MKLYSAHTTFVKYFSFDAEFKVLEWASGLIEEKGWGNIMWSSDALMVVKEINAKNSPNDWSASNDLLVIRCRFETNKWRMSWNARTSNILADLIAKNTASSNIPLFFYVYNLKDIPLDYLLCADLDVKEGCLVCNPLSWGFLCSYATFYYQKKYIYFSFVNLFNHMKEK